MKPSFKTAFATAAIALGAIALSACCDNKTADTAAKDATMNELKLTAEWDKVFPQSDKVNHSKVTFHNRFGITLAADLYIPKDTSLKVNGKWAAIAVSGPYGAVKEQVSGRYAQAMADRGYLTIAFDPSFTGESAGEPRNISSPDINTEDFSAAVDYLSLRDDVDPERIGVIGVCGWGGFALNVAAQDTRVKATAAITMYDMTAVTRDAYFKANATEEDHYQMKVTLNAQRLKDYNAEKPEYAGAVLDTVAAADPSVPQFVKDYSGFYRGRGYHKRSVGSTTGFSKTSSLSLLNMPILKMVNEIRTPVLLVHGEKAHSRYFSEDAFKAMTENGKGKYAKNKELMIIPGASHVDLYDNLQVIPFEKINGFFKANLTTNH